MVLRGQDGIMTKIFKDIAEKHTVEMDYGGYCQWNIYFPHWSSILPIASPNLKHEPHHKMAYLDKDKLKAKCTLQTQNERKPGNAAAARAFTNEFGGCVSSIKQME